MSKKEVKNSEIKLFQRSYYRRRSGKYMGTSDIWLIQEKLQRTEKQKLQNTTSKGN